MTIDLTAAFEEASRRAEGWDQWKSVPLAQRLGEVRDDVRFLGSGGVNWADIGNDDHMVAIVYAKAPLVIAEREFAREAAELLQDVVVVPEMTDYAENLFRFDRSKVDELLPYPADELDLDFDAFSAWDFEFETL